MDLEDVDPDTLLEWLDGNSCVQDEERALQASALERLCMLLLMSSNVDRCFDTYSPDVFVPALCRIFLDDNSPNYVLEVAARALTYFLDVSSECTHRISSTEGALEAISSKLQIENQPDRTDIDLAEQCLKILDRMSNIEPPCASIEQIIGILDKSASKLHTDSIQSALKVLQRICRSDRRDFQPDLRCLFGSQNPLIVKQALTCLPYIYQRGAPLPDPLPPQLLENPQLLSIMCRRVATVDAQFVLTAFSPGTPLDSLVADSLIHCLYEKSRGPGTFNAADELAARAMIEHILCSNAEFPNEETIGRLLEWTDGHGHSVLCWAAALGSVTQVKQLLKLGADPTQVLHIVARTDKVDNCKALLEAGANFEALDDSGRTALAISKEHMKVNTTSLLNMASVFWRPRRGLTANEDLGPYVDALLSVNSNELPGLRVLYKFAHYWDGASVGRLLNKRENLRWVSRLADVVLHNLRASKPDEERTLLALEICERLLEKHSSIFLPMFSRLGVEDRVTKLLLKLETVEEDEGIQDPDSVVFPGRQDRQFMIATIVPGRTLSPRTGIADRILTLKPFTWAGWTLVVTSEHALLWNSHVVIELSRTSKGRYNCFRDNMLYVVNSEENKGIVPVESLDEYIEFMDRLSFALSASVLATSDILPDTVLARGQTSGRPGEGQKLLGPWVLQKGGDDAEPSTIRHETCPHMLVVLQPNRNQFMYSNEEVELTIEGTHELSIISQSSPSSVVTESSVVSSSSRHDQRQQDFSLQKLKAKCVQARVFRLVNRLCEKFRADNSADIISEQTRIFNERALKCLDEDALPLLDMLSAKDLTRFELSTSKLIPSLMGCSIGDVFGKYAQHPGLVALVQAIVANFEDSVVADFDDWPLSESRTSRVAVRQLGNHVRMSVVTGQLDYPPDWDNDEKRLVCLLRAEATLSPFICLQQLREQLASKFIWSWYQQPRSQLTFVRQIKQDGPTDLTGRLGIVKWVGTNGQRCEWVDPMKAGLMKVWSSRHGSHDRRHRTQSGKYILKVGGAERTSASASGRRLHFQIDTGLYIRPTAYQLTTGANDGEMKRPFGWTTLVSRDAKNWSKADIVEVVKAENGERYVFAPMSEDTSVGFRHFRLEQFISDNTEYGFDLSHFELFGVVNDVCSTELNRTSALHRFAQSLRISRRPSGRWAFRLPNTWTAGGRAGSEQLIDDQLRALEAVTFELASGGQNLEDGASVLQNLFLSCRRRLQQREIHVEDNATGNITSSIGAPETSENAEPETEGRSAVEIEEPAGENIEPAAPQSSEPSELSGPSASNNEFAAPTADDRLEVEEPMPSEVLPSLNVDSSAAHSEVSASGFTPCDAELMMMLMMEQGPNDFEETHDDEEMTDGADDSEDGDDDEVREDVGEEAEDATQGDHDEEQEDDDCEDDLIVDDDNNPDYEEIYDYANQPLSTVFIDRKSKALAPAFDPRPGQFNVSSTQDLDASAFVTEGISARSRRSRRRRKSDRAPQLTITLEFNLSHPDVKNLKVAQIHHPLQDDQKCLLWHMRKALSCLPFNQRDELSKRLWEKIFRLRLDIAHDDQPNEDEDAGADYEEPAVDKSPQARVLEKLFVALQKTGDFDSSNFLSHRLTAIVEKTLSDSLTVASETQPVWLHQLLLKFPFLVPLEVRIRYFQALSFGTTRSLIWIIQDADLSTDFNITRAVGRLRRERSAVRRNFLLNDALTLLEYHCRHKAELEINWKDEDGTGLGPTMEFYTLLTEELQRNDLALWLTDNSEDKFVHSLFGLFPAPYPPDHESLENICRLFRLLGILIGKCLQDGRQCCELNLSRPLLKLLCPPIHHRPVSDSAAERLDLLDYRDFRIVQPDRARAFDELTGKSLEDMCLYFNYAPSSRIYNYMDYPLGGRSADCPVTNENFEEYVEAVMHFVLRDGIRAQMEALFEGISKVLPLQSLCCFLPDEFSLYLCGDNVPNWTKDELLQYIEPKNGYNRDSQTYLYLIDVFLDLDAEERRQVLQFITGCRSLPIGGLAALNPRLTVAKKEGSGYPSVNTCNHFLKLPEYNCADELKEKLLVSCKERGFYFN